eukprot:364108-Prymnesium_polylepis.1
MLLRPDSRTRCSIFAALTCAVCYLVLALPFELGWPEKMESLVPIREFCRALYVLDLIMTVLLAMFDVNDSDDDMRYSNARLDPRFWT